MVVGVGSGGGRRITVVGVVAVCWSGAEAGEADE